MNARQHAIGRAAFGGKAALAQLGDHHRMGIADAMGHARLLEGRGDDPDLAIGACKLGGDAFQHGQTRRVDPVVIGNENAHACPVPPFFMV